MSGQIDVVPPSLLRTIGRGERVPARLPLIVSAMFWGEAPCRSAAEPSLPDLGGAYHRAIAIELIPVAIRFVMRRGT